MEEPFPVAAAMIRLGPVWVYCLFVPSWVETKRTSWWWLAVRAAESSAPLQVCLLDRLEWLVMDTDCLHWFGLGLFEDPHLESPRFHPCVCPETTSRPVTGVETSGDRPTRGLTGGSLSPAFEVFRHDSQTKTGRLLLAMPA